jgi:16S rRNA (cytidine1402-2'-O)-methyltransferase
MEQATATGTLFLVGTPIGNLEDIGLRAIRVLREADIIACEDTRVTRGLLVRHAIGGKLFSYRQGNEETAGRHLIGELLKGRSVALVTDAGVPLLSDPGYPLVRMAIDAGVPVDAIPGPSAIPTALALSGLPPEPFAFFGFLPRKGSARSERLAAAAAFPGTVVLFESPRRIAGLLRDLAEALGDRPAALLRELTKIHQEARRGTLASLGAQPHPERGEYTVVVGPPSEPAAPESAGVMTPADAASLLASGGVPPRTSRDLLAALYGIPRKAAYDLALIAEKSKPDSRK